VQIVAVFLLNAENVNRIRNVLIVLGENVVVGKVFTLDKKRLFI